MGDLRITDKLLAGLLACPEHRAIFRRQWPNGIIPTARTAPAIVRLGLSIEWAAEVLLRAEYRERWYCAADAASEPLREATEVEHKAWLSAATVHGSWSTEECSAYRTLQAARDRARPAYRLTCALAFIAQWRDQGGSNV